MLNLKSLILLVCLSFSLQDNNCLVYFEYCEEEEEKIISISHCLDGSKEYCYQCEKNYYLSIDQKSCIKVEKPIDHCTKHFLISEGEYGCYDCENGYILSSYYQNCTRIEKPIDHCTEHYLMSEGGYGCYGCEDGFIPSDDTKSCKESKNCENSHHDGEKSYCSSCKKGYALSFDRKSCKQFDNCYKLEQGDTKCSKCSDKHFHPNADGICERTLCEKYDAKDVCEKCFPGYYLKDNQCEKITIPNCSELDEKNEKCKTCLGGAIKPDADGKCNLPSTLIKGCMQYDNNGQCSQCDNYYFDYEKTADGKSCKLKECKTGEEKMEYCAGCKIGYYREEDDNDEYFCMGYDGSRDTSSSIRNKVEYALLVFALLLLI